VVRGYQTKKAKKEEERETRVICMRALFLANLIIN
jgi:hypothetical protein